MLIHVLVLLVGAAVVWRAGTWLSADADALAARSRLGHAFVGMVLLGFVTSLPETATTVTAGALGNPSLAVGNLMGGVALQVVVLAVGDVVESRRAMTVQVSSPVLLLQHVALLLLLALAIAAMAVGEPVQVAGVGAWSVLILAVFLLALRVISRQPAPWAPTDDDTEQPGSDEGSEERARVPSWPRMVLSAVLILVAGWAIATSGDAIAGSGVLDATFVGATLVAVTTSLPEMSTVVGSLRAGSPEMAVSNIVGTNLFEVALLAVADVSFRGGAVLDHAGSGDIFLAALAAVLTCIYLAGILLREHRAVLRVGFDSAAVVVVYLLGIWVLART